MNQFLARTSRFSTLLCLEIDDRHRATITKSPLCLIECESRYSTHSSIYHRGSMIIYCVIYFNRNIYRPFLRHLLRVSNYNITLFIDMEVKVQVPSNCFCIQGEAHQMQPIQYICLQNSCILNRLLCKQCVQQSHRRHRVGIIDKLIQPLNRLNMNSGSQTSERDYNYIQDKIHSVVSEWEMLGKLCEKNASELENGIIFQLMTVMETFNSAQIDLAEVLLKDRDSDISITNTYVKKLNFLNKENLQDTEAVKIFIDYMTDRVKRSIRKTMSSIDLLLQKMQTHISELDFQKFNEFLEHPQLFKSKIERKTAKEGEKGEKDALKKQKVEEKSEEEETQKSGVEKKGNDSANDEEETRRARVPNTYATKMFTRKSGFQKMK